MDNPKERPKSAGVKSENLTPGSGVEEVVQRFDKAHATFAQAQLDLQANAKKQLEESYQNYATAMKDLSEDVQKRSQQTYRQLTDAVQDAAAKDDAAKLIEDAYRNYDESMRALAQDVQNRSSEAYSKYTNSAAEGQKAGQQQYLEAYRNYLRSLKEAWAIANIDAFIDSIST